MLDGFDIRYIDTEQELETIRRLYRGNDHDLLLEANLQYYTPAWRSQRKDDIVRNSRRAIPP